jgi:hypothetical protein
LFAASKLHPVLNYALPYPAPRPAF